MFLEHLDEAGVHVVAVEIEPLVELDGLLGLVQLGEELDGDAEDELVVLEVLGAHVFPDQVGGVVLLQLGEASDQYVKI